MGCLARAARPCLRRDARISGSDKSVGKPSLRFPASVRRFLVQSIASVEQLEVVLLIHRAPDRFWDAIAIAEHLGLRTDHANAALEALAGQSLLDIRLGETIKYRFNPASSEQRECVKRLADLWRERREDVIREMTRTRSSLTDFSDAFRIKWDDDDHG